MFSHDAMRALYGDRFLTFPLTGAFSGAVIPLPGQLLNVPTTATVVARFVCPGNLVLKRVSVAVDSGDAASSALTAQVRRGTTVLAAATTVAGTAASAVRGTEVTVPLTVAESLNLAVLAANATDDFTGVTVIVELEPLKTDS